MKKTIFAIAVLALAFFTVWLLAKKPAEPSNVAVSNTQEQKQQAQQAEPPPPASINGLPVTAEVAARRPIAVIVENYPDARPQSGLINADVVYEALTEGGITRFLAIYQANDVKSIGPVRSARTYFVDIANELGALFAHVGGNSDALAHIKQGLYKNISDADQFFDDGTYFSRVKSRLAPHNVYTSTNQLRKFIEAKRLGDTSNFSPWQFKDGTEGGGVGDVAAENISIDFSLSQYSVRYQYDAKSNNYLRFMAGKPHTDPVAGKQISVKTVIAQMVRTFPVKSDTPLSIGMALEEGGEAYVFQDGRVISGTWKKDGTARTRYYDSEDREIKFNRGTMWVELVPEDRSVDWK